MILSNGTQPGQHPLAIRGHPPARTRPPRNGEAPSFDPTARPGVNQVTGGLRSRHHASGKAMPGLMPPRYKADVMRPEAALDHSARRRWRILAHQGPVAEQHDLRQIASPVSAVESISQPSLSSRRRLVIGHRDGAGESCRSKFRRMRPSSRPSRRPCKRRPQLQFAHGSRRAPGPTLDAGNSRQGARVISSVSARRSSLSCAVYVYSSVRVWTGPNTHSGGMNPHRLGFGRRIQISKRSNDAASTS